MSKYKRKEEFEADSKYSEELEAQVSADAEPKGPEEASFKKRYGDLRRHTQQLMSQKDHELEKLKAQLDSAARGQIKFPKTDDEIEAWSKKYPDVSKIVDTIARKRANEVAENLRVGEKRLENIEIQITKRDAEKQLMKKHPDFMQIRSDPSFHEWVALQPLYIQDALYKNNTDATAASRAIDLYKADTGRRTKSNPKSAAQAVGRSTSAAPAATGKAKFSESQVARMSDREYEANEEAILQAMRTEGAFTYDMTGGAR
jgi:seryl-tRNA synthetase